MIIKVILSNKENKLKKTIISVVLVFNLSFGVDLEDGYKALENGDYNKALSIFEYLSSMNHSKAIFILGYM